ncbi:protein of unknown function [Xenorhabdus nematophila AN6/1]|nr:protein of unknown function [Xenorhabdus nematophila AN6/1]
MAHTHAKPEQIEAYMTLNLIRFLVIHRTHPYFRGKQLK